MTTASANRKVAAQIALFDTMISYTNANRNAARRAVRRANAIAKHNRHNEGR